MEKWMLVVLLVSGTSPQPKYTDMSYPQCIAELRKWTLAAREWSDRTGYKGYNIAVCRVQTAEAIEFYDYESTTVVRR